MQLFSRKKAFTALSLGALFALGACGDNITVPAAVLPPVLISMTPTNASMNIGESLTLAVQITGGSTTAVPTLASCTSSNAAVATAAIAGLACRVTAVTSGNVTVTAAASTGNAASTAITVAAAAAAISNLTTSPTTASIAVGQSVTIVPNVARAATSVTPTYAYATSSSAIASVSAAGVVAAVAPGTATITVTATGSGTGFSTATLTAGVTITVTAAPNAINALTVQPASLVMALGSTLTLNSTASQPTGAATATIGYTSSVPTIATVGATSGTVVAVSPGTAVITVTATAAANANFAAATLVQLVSVTVTPSANVTIQDIRQGPVVTSAVNNSDISLGLMAGILTSANSQVNQPVDITNVRDQIQVLINLQPNGQRVDSVVAYIANADGSNRRAAARQLYSNGTANASDITLFINTADFDADFTAATSTVFYPNGQKIISASVFTTNSAGAASELQNASNNRQTVNFNNVDGYAARNVNPTNVATNAATNLNYWGGPGASGTGTFTVVPVFYTAGRTVSTLTLGMRQGLTFSVDVCNETGVFQSGTNTVLARTGTGLSRELYTAAAPIFRATYNGDVGRTVTTGTSTATGFNTLGNTNIECLGYEHPASNQSNIMGVVSGTDNQNNAIPLTTFAAGYRFSAQIPQPANNRLDYMPPSTTTPDIRRASPAVTGWVNAAFNFQNNTPASTDAGVGMPTTLGRSWFYRPAGASPASSQCGSDTSWVAMPTSTGADIPECATNFVGGWDNTLVVATVLTGGTRLASPYLSYIIERDALGNQATSSASSVFGVDKIASNVRWSSASRADTAIVSVGFTVDFQSEAIDERSGFIDLADQGSGGTIPAPTKSSTGTISALTSASRSQSHFAARAWAGALTLATPLSNKATCINGDNFTAITGIGAAIITAPACAFNTPTTPIGAILGDGWRQGSPVNLAAQEGIYNYQSRWTDRAGNVSVVQVVREAVETSSPLIVNLLMPVSVTATSSPIIGYEAQDNVEIRAVTMANSYSNLPTTSWLRYPQVLTDARFNDVVNSPVGAGQASVPVGAPYVLGMANSFAATATTTQTAAVNTWNVRNNGSNPLSGGYLTQGFPVLNSFDAQFGVGAYTSWAVLQSRAAGFNAPEGLKAQLISNTNVTNQAFVRVDFFRLTTSTSEFSGVTGGVTGGAQQWQYLGSSTTAASADIGTTRYWTFQLADANYASLPNSFETKQNPYNTTTDVIIAVGVRANGAGLVTATVTPAPVASITLTVAGLPAGGAANITITDGAGYSQGVTASGTYILPAAGTYFVNAGNTTVSSANYAPTVAVQNVVATLGTPVPVTVTYGLAATQINVTVSGLLSGTANFTITGPGGYTATYTTQGNGLVTYNVPQNGAYTVTGANVTSGVFVHTVSAPVNVTVATGPTPAAASVVYTNTTQRINITVTSPVSASVTFLCTGGASGTAFSAVGGLTTTFNIGTGQSACVITANAVSSGGFTYLPAVSGSPITPSVTATPGAGSVTYTVATPQLTIISQSIGGGTNNLPSGIPYTVRVSSSAYAAMGGFQDFSGMTGTNLVIPVPQNGTYNVSIRNQLTLVSQQWTVAVVGDVTAAGGLTTGTPALSGSPQNVVVSNFVFGPSGSPVLANFQGTVTINWTGPTP